MIKLGRLIQSITCRRITPKALLCYSIVALFVVWHLYACYIHDKYLDGNPAYWRNYGGNASFVRSECWCRGENFCFKGLDETGALLYGRPFSCDLYERLREFELLDSDARKAQNDFDSLDADKWVPVFMTATSTNHYEESKKMLESVHNFYSQSRVIYFDTGLREEEVEELRKMPNVDYRRFNFSAYPSHVAHLRKYAFKIAQIEMFREHKTFYYFDASVRVRDKLEHLSGVKSGELLPVAMYRMPNVKHSAYSTTHPGMTEYLPVPKRILRLPELETNAVFFSDSAFTRYMLKWWLLCAMTADCIAPYRSRAYCDLTAEDTFQTYLSCHRFDQAYYNLATLAYMFGEERGAIKYGFIKRNWTQLDDELIDNFHENRLAGIEKYAPPIRIMRSKHDWTWASIWNWLFD